MKGSNIGTTLRLLSFYDLKNAIKFIEGRVSPFRVKQSEISDELQENYNLNLQDAKYLIFWVRGKEATAYHAFYLKTKEGFAAEAIADFLNITHITVLYYLENMSTIDDIIQVILASEPEHKNNLSLLKADDMESLDKIVELIPNLIGIKDLNSSCYDDIFEEKVYPHIRKSLRNFAVEAKKEIDLSSELLKAKIDLLCELKIEWLCVNGEGFVDKMAIFNSINFSENREFVLDSNEDDDLRYIERIKNLEAEDNIKTIRDEKEYHANHTI